MIQDFKSESDEFRGQRWLTTLLLLALAVGMVVLGLKELSSGQLTTAGKTSAAAQTIPARLSLPGQNFEIILAETNLNQAGKLTGAGWLNTSPRPGEPGTAVIGVNPEESLANLKPGDRLEITGQNGRKLVFEITGSTVMAFSLVTTGQNEVAGRELKLVVLGPEGQAANRVITARQVTTN